MKETHPIKDKRITPCVEPSGYQTHKNRRKQFYSHCAVSGTKKVRYVKNNGLGKKKPKCPFWINTNTNSRLHVPEVENKLVYMRLGFEV